MGFRAAWAFMVSVHVSICVGDKMSRCRRAVSDLDFLAVSGEGREYPREARYEYVPYTQDWYELYLLTWMILVPTVRFSSINCH